MKEKLSNIEAKLERLLTGYLDQVIDKDEYQFAKKKLVEEKSNIEEELHQLQSNRFKWVELVKEFIETASESGKAARATYEEACQ